MSKATLVGYHGRRNLGDDIFLRVATAWLQRHFAVQRIFVTGKKGRMPTVIDGVPVKPFEIPNFFSARFIWLQILYYSLRSDVLLFAAGSIFTIQPFLLAYCVVKAVRLVRPHTPVVALGVSIGPLHGKFAAYWCGKLLELFDSIIVRDAQSAEWLRTVAPQAPCTLGYDIALTWRAPEKLTTKGGNPVIAICVNEAVRQAAGAAAFERSLMDVLVAAILSCTNSFNRCEVVLLTVCTDERDGDGFVTHELARLLSDNKIDSEIVAYDGENPDEYVQGFDRCDAVITSRMHTGVVGMMRGIPVLQIAYARKIIDFYAQCNLGSEDLFCPERLTRRDVETFLSLALSGKRQSLAARRETELNRCAASILEVMEQEGSARG